MHVSRYEQCSVVPAPLGFSRGRAIIRTPPEGITNPRDSNRSGPPETQTRVCGKSSSESLHRWASTRIINPMASSSGDETSVELMSPVSSRQAPGQEPAFAHISSNSATGHAPVGLRPAHAAQLDRAFAKNDEWSQYKPLMRRLYMDENKTLAEVREHMRIQYGFTASWVYSQTRRDSTQARLTNTSLQGQDVQVAVHRLGLAEEHQADRGPRPQRGAQHPIRRLCQAWNSDPPS